MADLYVCRITYDDGTVEETRPLPRCDAERIVDQRRSRDLPDVDDPRFERYSLEPTSQIPLFEVER